MTFAQVMALTDTVSSPTAFDEDACRLLYDTLLTIPDESHVVEIGCEYGRSSSLIGQVGKEKRLNMTFIDCFDGEVRESWMAMMTTQVKCAFTLHAVKTANLSQRHLPLSIHLAHIDGDHSTKGVSKDCSAMLPRIAYGGYLSFHDYGRDSLPDVKTTVDMFIRSYCWQEVGYAGTLLVMRRIS
jgi:hypothetical protein